MWSITQNGCLRFLLIPCKLKSKDLDNLTCFDVRNIGSRTVSFLGLIYVIFRMLRDLNDRVKESCMYKCIHLCVRFVKKGRKNRST